MNAGSAYTAWLMGLRHLQVNQGHVESSHPKQKNDKEKFKNIHLDAVRVHAAEMRFLCRVAWLSLCDSVKNSEIRRDLETESLFLQIERRIGSGWAFYDKDATCLAPWKPF